MDKRSVTDVLSRLAFAREVLDGPTEEAKYLSMASRSVFMLEGDLEEMSASGALARMRNVGKEAAALVAEVLAGGTPAELVEREARIPAGLFEIKRIKGLGPAKIRALWSGLGVTSLGELEQACKENRLLSLPGFGQKTQSNVLAAIADVRANEGKLLRSDATERSDALLAALRADPDVRRAVAVGGLPRGFEIVERVEVVVDADDDAVARVLAAAGVRDGKQGGVHVDVHRAAGDVLGCAEVRLTSADAHWDALVTHAASLGLALAPDALRRGGAETAASDGEALIAAPDADALYAALALVPTAPERREDGVPLVHVGSAAPKLVTRGDLRGALHNHTVASDGTATLAEMRAAAEDAGLEYLGINEHSESAAYARGLDAARLAAQRAEIAALLARDPDGPAIVVGVESDILEDGALDYAPDVLSTLEVVVASGHRRFGLDRERTTQRMLRAARDPFTDIVGHPTGRLLLGRAPNDFDVLAFLDACAESGCAVELNGSPQRLDLEVKWLVEAKARGVIVSLAADAHATDELVYLDYAVSIARRAGLGPEDVLNTRTLPELRTWLGARRAKRGVA